MEEYMSEENEKIKKKPLRNSHNNQWASNQLAPQPQSAFSGTFRL